MDERKELLELLATLSAAQLELFITAARPVLQGLTVRELSRPEDTG